MKDLKNYTVDDFKIDMTNFSQEDINMYEEGTNFAFPGSNINVTLRENSIANVLDHDDKRYLSAKDKTILRLAMIFSKSQDSFDELFFAGFTTEEIANAFKTTANNVEMKLIYDAAKTIFLENNKVKSYK